MVGRTVIGRITRMLGEQPRRGGVMPAMLLALYKLREAKQQRMLDAQR